MVDIVNPWSGDADPNSTHQLWSRWTFKLRSERLDRHPPQTPLHHAFRRWCGVSFGSAGEAHCDEWVHTHGPTQTVTAKGYILWCEVEGPPVTEPTFQLFVRRRFRIFVDVNWSRRVLFEMDSCILAGDAEDGKPPRQLLVLPFHVDSARLQR